MTEKPEVHPRCRLEVAMGVTVYFLRHGQTRYNSEKRFYGVTDIGLNDTGAAEALYAAENLKTIAFAGVYSSPLSRAMETAAIVMEHNAAPVEIVRMESMREVDFGEWEGMLASDIEAKYAPDWKDYIKRFYEYTFPNGDNIRVYNERVKSCMEELIKRHDGGNILIVSHKGFILSAISSLLHGDYKSMFRYDLDTGKLALLETFDGFCILKALNI